MRGGSIDARDGRRENVRFGLGQPAVSVFTGDEAFSRSCLTLTLTRIHDETNTPIADPWMGNPSAIHGPPIMGDP